MEKPVPISPEMPLDPQKESILEGIIIHEVQLLLAEKRTSLSVMRTGITVLALPLSVLSVLVATSKYYDVTQALPLIIPLMVLCAGLLVLGVYLTHRAVVKIQRYEQCIQKLKRKHGKLAEFVD